MIEATGAWAVIPNGEVSTYKLNWLRKARQIVTLDFTGARLVYPFSFSAMNLQYCTELTTLTFANTSELSASSTTMVTIPTTWKNLTRLKTVSFLGAGMTGTQVETIINSWLPVVQAGMGSATTAKTLVLTGNGAPVLANISAAKTALLALGWTVTHA